VNRASRSKSLIVESAPIHSPASRSASSSDELYFLLEGRTVEGRGEQWQVEVCGVYSAGAQRWIQLNLRGPYTCGVTLRCGSLPAEDVIDLLHDWLDDSLPARHERRVVSHASAPLIYAFFARYAAVPMLTM